MIEHFIATQNSSKPMTMGKETPGWWGCPITARGKADPQSLVHPSLMPALVARAVSCLRHTEKKNQYLLIWKDNCNLRGKKPTM